MVKHESSESAELSEALRAREQALRRFEAFERDFPVKRDAASALAGIAWLYDMLPPDSRKRDVDPSGIQSLHACLSVLRSNTHR